MFDILLCNKDRHTANIIVDNQKIIPIDHTMILSREEVSSRYIKMGIGMKVNSNYINILEKLKMNRSKLTIKEVLVNLLGFSSLQFNKIKQINETEIRKIIKDNDLIKNKNELYFFIIHRIKNFDNLPFI